MEKALLIQKHNEPSSHDKSCLLTGCAQLCRPPTHLPSLPKDSGPQFLISVWRYQIPQRPEIRNKPRQSCLRISEPRAQSFDSGSDFREGQLQDQRPRLVSSWRKIWSDYEGCELLSEQLGYSVLLRPLLCHQQSSLLRAAGISFQEAPFLQTSLVSINVGI